MIIYIIYMSLSTGLCQYKDIIGKPNEGTRAEYRIFRGIIGPNGIAFIDTLVTIFAGLSFSFFTGFTWWKVLLGLLILEIVSHRAFCVRTGIDQFLFP